MGTARARARAQRAGGSKSNAPAAPQAPAPSEQIDYKGRLRHSCIYIIFMVFYCFEGLRYLLDAEVYYLKSHIEDQFSGNEFSKEHSPTTGKTFHDITTIDEWYQWLQGPLQDSLFSTTSSHNQRPGYILQNNRILGSVVISQLRAKKHDCTDSVPSAFRNFQWFCYDTESRQYGVKGYFDQSRESTNDFGSYCNWISGSSGQQHNLVNECTGNCSVPLPWGRNSKHYVNGSEGCYGPFLYEGINGHTGNAVPLETKQHNLFAARLKSFKKSTNDADSQGSSTNSSDVDSISAMRSVVDRRSQLMTAFTTKLFNVYPVGAFGVFFNPGGDAAQAQSSGIAHNLKLSRYVDLQTKVLFVDLTLYNPMLDHIAAVKLVAEITKSGGVMTSAEVEVVRLWENVTSADNLFHALSFVLLGFYVYFIQHLFHRWRKCVTMHGKNRGSKLFWYSFPTWLQLTNILFFFGGMGCSLYAVQLIPPVVDVTSDTFVDFGPAVRFKNMATAVQATNAFINWSSLIVVLSYSPVFAVMTLTLSAAYEATKSFMIIFAIVFFGFAQAYCQVYVGKLDDFKSLGTTMMTMTRMLLGDFDFLAMQESSMYIGPILFLVFVGLAVFVVLMMLVAIISDQYEETKQKMRLNANTGVLHDIKMYAMEIGNWIGRYIPCVQRLLGDSQALENYSQQVALREKQRRGEHLSQLEQIEIDKAMLSDQQRASRKQSQAIDNSTDDTIQASDIKAEMSLQESSGYVAWSPACPPPPPVSHHPEAEHIYVELELRERSITLIQSRVRQKQAVVRVKAMHAEMQAEIELDSFSGGFDSAVRNESQVSDASTKSQVISVSGVGDISFQKAANGNCPIDQQGLRLAPGFVSWSPNLPAPPVLEFHPEEHLVKAELRQRSKAALLIQNKVRQRRACSRAQSRSKQIADENYASLVIQSRMRTFLVRTSYPGKRVHQALQRLEVRKLLRRKSDRLKMRKKVDILCLEPPPPPAEPPLSSAMNYWMQTLGENKNRLDHLTTDMGALQAELDCVRCSLRQGLDKMHEIVQRRICNATSSDIQEYGNIITVDTIRLRAPHMNPLAHVEAVDGRWLYDPWSGQSLVAGATHYHKK